MARLEPSINPCLVPFFKCQLLQLSQMPRESTEDTYPLIKEFLSRSFRIEAFPWCLESLSMMPSSL